MLNYSITRITRIRGLDASNLLPRGIMNLAIEESIRGRPLRRNQITLIRELIYRRNTKWRTTSSPKQSNYQIKSKLKKLSAQYVSATIAQKDPRNLNVVSTMLI